ncbi:MAG: thiamine-phosphate kinase [Planctomycetaceae bacterium]|nr:thiamine-phosphate kinase [Planctomycetaceae bacterium]
MVSELNFLRTLQHDFPAAPPVVTGIGDDGAVIDATDESRQVVVADMLLDGTHFDLTKAAPEQIGRKALAVNLSDLAAMGCRPVAAFVCLALPRSLAGDFLSRLYHGLSSLAEQFDCSLAGGDTNSWQGPFAISVTVTGVPFGDRIPLRSEARVGDMICVTGPLGGSLPSGRHLTFTPQLAVSEQLLEQYDVRAMMDISDGLSVDLARMMEASGTSAVLRADDVPVHPDVDQRLPRDQQMRHALHDGEDFELLLTLPQRPDHLPDGVSLIPIGEVTAGGTAIRLQHADGSSEPLRPEGWQHSV